jgi:hypothetical protein
MTDKTSCLRVRVPVQDNLVEEFDKILSDLRECYIKTHWHSFVPPNHYEFLILFYDEKEKITSFLNEYNIFHKFRTISENEFNLISDILVL